MSDEYLNSLLKVSDSAFRLILDSENKSDINTCALQSIAASLLVIATKMAEDK